MKHAHQQNESPSLAAQMRDLADRHPRTERALSLRHNAILFEQAARSYSAGAITPERFAAVWANARREFFASGPSPYQHRNPDWPQQF